MLRCATILPALALAGGLGLLWVPEAEAQTASNLDCTKCVDKSDIAKKAVTGVKIKNGSVGLKDLSPEVRQFLKALMAVVSIDEVKTDLNGDGKIDPKREILPRVLFKGVNVQVVNGHPSKGTYSLNGLGNLIVGYNEKRTDDFRVCSDGQYDDNDPNDGDPGCENEGEVWAKNHKSGSHNLVVGGGHAYSRAGGVVFGGDNLVNRNGASVTGGLANTASGIGSSVSGGSSNRTSGNFSRVGGGSFNTVSGISSSVNGGIGNTASGTLSSVSGGEDNTASGYSSSVSGGLFNTASGEDSTVSGGIGNTAAGPGAHVP